MKLLEAADRYCKESNWKTIALLKICLFSIGIMVGTLIPKEKKKTVLRVGATALLVAYVPLMEKFFYIWQAEKQEKMI